MPEICYVLSSEETDPNDLVRNARRAEEAGFYGAWISDHYHPWVDAQGQSPFVWSVIGGIAAVTERLRLGTGVTCPTIRIHPAILAQAAATSQVMLEGRFFFGVGSGENLNEHILGDRWPEADVRLEMLEEAVAVIRLLWEGGNKSHHGRYYTVENARLYTLPGELPPIYVSAFGPKAIEVAARIGDGYVGTAPEKELLDAFAQKAGPDKPKIGEMKVCWHEDEAEARRMIHRLWPNIGLPGELAQELPSPKHFEQAASIVTEEMVADTPPTGPDPEPYLESIRQYEQAGYDEVYLHQIGPDQEGFFRFCEREILPHFN
ncbi:TIGR03557 family F420-dependent LLM class oxidoreductase [Rubrobacter taiwanensis]|jgi:G6PDH family F420-dependent oxidoreductase|uniref:TIGR03557 family F420-dependent LLM class oxidoreductase n=1 Tax=Rubrobacter taiwanensis TaxID=185139 RepID=A0A4R1BSA9_9ACTN|nr:TIGR03557 family F420-dependent LLM class oxidoreductase [Rubrobacter taiwanensis]TCJ20541.1 TIGR03557 family F420-dependent LLM class oxidoreductase [Rubrobacter taiwanensis]